jgi:WD40 repeat protein
MKKLSVLLISILLTASSWTRTDPYLIFPTGHKVIYDICFSQNGSTLIVADGQEIKWFSSKDGHLLSTLSGGHRNTILALDLSADSSLLASGGRDSSVLIWDVSKKEVIKRLNHKGIVTTVRWSPDHRYLLSGATDHKVYCYDVLNNKMAAEFSDHSDDVTSIDASSDGRFFASASADGTVRIYDLETVRLLSSIQDRRSWVRKVRFNANATRLFSCGDNSILNTWNVADPKTINKWNSRRIGHSWLLSVDCFGDSVTYATGSLGGVVSISTPFGGYTVKLHSVVSKVIFKPGEGTRVNVAVATLGKGVMLINASKMKAHKK